MTSSTQKIGIIGLGLIGGSLALSLAEHGLEVCAFVRSAAKINLSRAEQAGIKQVTEDFTLLKDCDIVFVCVALNQISNTLRQIAPYLKEGSIVTDVGSVKQFICQEAQSIFQGQAIHFIGGHPMAGTEKAGFENASADLFENRPWVLIERELTSDKKGSLSSSDSSQTHNSFSGKGSRMAVDLLESVIAKTQAKIIRCAPEIHDLAVAYISHLPLRLSIALKETVEQIEDPPLREMALSLASSGYESMTRLARGNPVLNNDLLSLNKNNLNASLVDFVKNLDGL